MFYMTYDFMQGLFYKILYMPCFMPIMIAIFVIIYTVISLLCIYIHLIVIGRLIVFCTNVDFNCNSDVK